MRYDSLDVEFIGQDLGWRVPEHRPEPFSSPPGLLAAPDVDDRTYLALLTCVQPAPQVERATRPLPPLAEHGITHTDELALALRLQLGSDRDAG